MSELSFLLILLAGLIVLIFLWISYRAIPKRKTFRHDHILIADDATIKEDLESGNLQNAHFSDEGSLEASTQGIILQGKERKISIPIDTILHVKSIKAKLQLIYWLIIVFVSIVMVFWIFSQYGGFYGVIFGITFFGTVIGVYVFSHTSTLWIEIDYFENNKENKIFIAKKFGSYDNKDKAVITGQLLLTQRRYSSLMVRGVLGGTEKIYRMLEALFNK